MGLVIDQVFRGYLPAEVNAQLTDFDVQIEGVVSTEEKLLAALGSELFAGVPMSRSELADFTGVEYKESGLAIAGLEHERRVWRYDMSYSDVLEKRFAIATTGARLLIARYAFSQQTTIAQVRATTHHHKDRKESVYKLAAK